MCKATIFLILTVCLLAQCYEISKNYYDEPCFEKESADARDTDYKNLLNEAEYLGRDQIANGTIDLDTFSRNCKKIKDLIFTSINLPNLPRCSNFTSYPFKYVNVTMKLHFARGYFDFTCNLKQNEFDGLVKWFTLLSTFREPMSKCADLMERTFLPNGYRKIPDFCGDKVSEMLSCFRKILVGDDDAIAFHKALTNYFIKQLCVGKMSDEEYGDKFEKLYEYNDYARYVPL